MARDTAASILGPAVSTTLSSGRRAGIAVGCGLGLIAAAWTMMALLGLEAVFQLFPWAYVTAKTAGAIYLLYIAYKMWVGAKDTVDPHIRPARHALRQGMMINLLNPKSVLFAAAVLIMQSLMQTPQRQTKPVLRTG